MASDTFIGDGLAKSPYREILEKVIQLEQEVFELSNKLQQTEMNLLPHVTDDEIAGLRPCTCAPDERPYPCQHQYALGLCRTRRIHPRRREEMSLCVVCQFDGRRQEDLIDLKDGQIDQLRSDLSAAQQDRQKWYDLAHRWLANAEVERDQLKADLATARALLLEARGWLDTWESRQSALRDRIDAAIAGGKK